MRRFWLTHLAFGTHQISAQRQVGLAVIRLSDPSQTASYITHYGKNIYYCRYQKGYCKQIWRISEANVEGYHITEVKSGVTPKLSLI